MNTIQDYLQTQGLHLNIDDISIAQLAAQTVMQQGQAVIEHNILWPQSETFTLHQFLEKTESHTQLLKQIFMALDSIASRQSIQSAVIYGITEQRQLIRLAQYGLPIETTLSLNDDTAQQYLAARTAQNGWLNLMHETETWLKNGDISGSFNHRSAMQASFPICDHTGHTYGVIHIEHAHANGIDTEAQTQWVGLALALIAPLQTLLPHHQPESLEEL